MANENGNGGSAPVQSPALNVLAQYVKDLSFENPNAPRSLQPQNNAPGISIQVNVGYGQLSESEYDVTLTLEGNAGEGVGLLFNFELKYGGVFRLQGIPQDQMHPVLMIECPRLLFPFARQIIAEAVRNGGFPPLYIDPIDFMGLYQQRMAETNAAPVS
jgi:preprotein translocase subunit SecB